MDYILQELKKINDIINGIVWGPFMLCFLVIVGMLFTVSSGFFQVTKVKHWVKNTIGTFFSYRSKAKKNSGSISIFQAMTTALAGAIGTGNIVGVATAIALGGPGAVFWMWVASFFGMMTIFAENVLGVKYRERNKKGELVGGPMYYIEKGLGQKWLATVFSIFCVFATLGMGNMTQANSIAGAISETFCIEPKYTAIFLCLIVAMTILGGVKRIAKVSEKIVPFMALFYLTGGGFVIFVNIKSLPVAFASILQGAFSAKSATGGLMGVLTSNSVKYGISRGVFSNEAGLGSSPIIYSASEESEPVVQGMWGIFQVFFDTIVACSVTAFCILCTGAHAKGSNGIELSNIAFESVFGRFGSIFLTLSIVMFCFATIVGWSCYGERSLEYIAGEKYIPIYKAIYIVLVLFGCVMDLNLVWDLSDTFNGLMAIPNLIALVLLSGEVIKEVQRYSKST